MGAKITCWTLKRWPISSWSIKYCGSWPNVGSCSCATRTTEVTVSYVFSIWILFFLETNRSIPCFFFFFSGAVNRFLSHHWFIVFSKISYSFYLIQFVFFFYDVATIRYPDTFQIFKLVKYHFIPSRKILPPFSPPPILLQIINSMFQINGSEFVSLLFWSIVVTLIFDIPMQEVKNYIMRKWIDRQGRSNDVYTNWNWIGVKFCKYSIFILTFMAVSSLLFSNRLFNKRFFYSVI